VDHRRWHWDHSRRHRRVFVSAECRVSDVSFRPRQTAGHGATASSAPLYAGVDEYRVCGWALGHDGSFRSFRLDNGDALSTQTLVPSDSLSVASFDARSGSLALARTDGRIQLYRIAFETSYPAESELPSEVKLSHAGECATIGDAVIERTAEGSLRRQHAKLEDAGTIPAAGMAALRAVDHIAVDKGFMVATLAGDSLIVDRVNSEENEFTGESTASVDRRATAAREAGENARVLVTEEGNSVLVISATGSATLVDVRDDTLPVIVSGNVAKDASITAATTLIGRSTILVGDAKGNVTSWFTAETNGQRKLVSPRVFRGDGSAVTSIAASARERLFVAGYADGRVRMFQGTSGKRVIDMIVDPKARIDALAFAPKTDGLLVASGCVAPAFRSRDRPSRSDAAFALPSVWYEGYAAPTHVWQSSAGTDDFEAKLGSGRSCSEPSRRRSTPCSSACPCPPGRHLHQRVRGAVTAPALEDADRIDGQPAQRGARIPRRASLCTVRAGTRGLGDGGIPDRAHDIAYRCLPLAAASRPDHAATLALPLRPHLPRTAGFDGAGCGDGPVGGTRALRGRHHVVARRAARQRIRRLGAAADPAVRGNDHLCRESFYEGRFRRASMTRSRSGVAGLDFARFVASAVATLLLSIAVAGLLTLLHADPRGGFFGTYVQRNALVVGFVMGFAIIPIIYTIAEDALSAVPSHLRAASLGAGATPWQTAVRIVLPTAMSGLFSAIMIGLGRAVGETMIVLMAAGNTPVVQMNVFNGFRTLSANIAVELPEAVRNSSHYRTLFFAALMLFGMTFIVNTVAEIVRLRFRKRSAQI
jgi:phosphate transport system permease protein